MKAISFLECYYNEGTLLNYLLKDNKEDVDKCMKVTLDFINNTSSYCMKVSQPFSFEKVVELFEGFEIDDRGLYLVFKDLLFETICDEMYYYISYSTFLDLDSDDSEVHSIGITPKTIDEFITLCNNLNIELTWKQ